MKSLSLILAAAIIPGSSAAQAAGKSAIEQRHSATYNRCMATGDAAEGITSGMLECTEAERNFQDGKLNQAYKMIMSRISANRQESLRLSERNWIKARDAICAKDLKGEFAGGSMGHVSWLDCLVEETIKRTIVLEQYR